MSDRASIQGAVETASAVRAGALSARDSIAGALARIAALDPALNAFTDVCERRAFATAEAIDARRARGEALGPLAGVPFAVKNLFDVAGLPTRAGSKINREHAPAEIDATLVRKLEEADAVLVGALNMGEYAYDFTGENQHDGPSRNPHDPDHMSGGSSGGSGTAVASGMVPLALGSDTNGSIRVPSSFCGLFGLKPTYGRLSRAGAFPFVASLDHLGPMARSVADLALAYDVTQGLDERDAAQARHPPRPASDTLDMGVSSLRIARAGGYFASGGEPDCFAAVERIAHALGAPGSVEIPEARRARAAAYLITMAEGAALHADRLRARASDFDADTRDRLIAGTMIPAHWVVRAQKFRRWHHDAVIRLFDDVDIILAPSTPVKAPRIGQKTMVLDGVEMAARANIGMFTQPISFIGLPVVGVPVWVGDGKLPIGVQIIAAPWREDLALRVARWLEVNGIVSARVAGS